MSGRSAARLPQRPAPPGRMRCRGRTARGWADRKGCARMDRDYELQTHQAEDRHWWYRGRRTVIERVLAGMRLPARARILDAGCGSGRNMIELARHGTVTGVELSPTSVCLARERGVGEVIEGSVLDMPFSAAPFALVVAH